MKRIFAPLKEKGSFGGYLHMEKCMPSNKVIQLNFLLSIALKSVMLQLLKLESPNGFQCNFVDSEVRPRCTLWCQAPKPPPSLCENWMFKYRELLKTLIRYIWRRIIIWTQFKMGYFGLLSNQQVSSTQDIERMKIKTRI